MPLLGGNVQGFALAALSEKKNLKERNVSVRDSVVSTMQYTDSVPSTMQYTDSVASTIEYTDSVASTMQYTDSPFVSAHTQRIYSASCLKCPPVTAGVCKRSVSATHTIVEIYEDRVHSLTAVTPWPHH